MTSDTDLDTRLAALEARVPTDSTVPGPLTGPGRRGAPRLVASIATAGVLVLAVGATALAVAAASGLIAFGSPGVENPGQPLEGATLECMTPPQAAAYLADHGFTNVVWQIETTDKGSGSQPSAQTSTPPDHGYVVPGSIVGGQLLMVVDQRAGATGSGACPDLPMP